MNSLGYEKWGITGNLSSAEIKYPKLGISSPNPIADSPN